MVGMEEGGEGEPTSPPPPPPPSCPPTSLARGVRAEGGREGGREGGQVSPALGVEVYRCCCKRSSFASATREEK